MRLGQWLVRLAVLCAVVLPCAVRAQDKKILLPVMHGQTEVAHVIVHADESDRVTHVEAARLLPWVDEYLSPQSKKTLADITAADGRFAIEQAVQAGFRLVYDAENIWLRAEPDPASLRRRQLSVQEKTAAQSQPPLEMATFSGFLNLRAGQDYLHNTATGAGRQPLRLDLDGALNFKGWVLEARGDYLEDDRRAWRRDNLRLIHDWPDSMVRLALGDLSYPVSSFQAYQPMLGVSLARNFTLQPYRITAPSGQTSFVLQSPSRVDVIVNGQRIRTLQLEPGPYDISDFPIADGSNDVMLRITDAAGNTEEKSFTLLGAQRLLQAGLHEYAYNIGIKSNHAARRIAYDAQDPVFSGFHRLGLRETLTGGLSFQADKTVQQAGLSFVTATALGTVGAEGMISDTRAADHDIAARLSYSYRDIAGRRNFVASAEYRGADFAALGTENLLNPFKWEAAAGYYHTIFSDIHAGIGGRYRFARGDQDDSWSYSANFRKALSPSLSVNINGQHQHRAGAGIFVGFTWVPRGGNHTVTTAIDTLNNSQSTRWDWQSERRWQAGAGLTRDDGDLQGTGNIFYRGQRLEASAYHDINRFQAPSGAGGAMQDRTEQRTQLRGGAALAFADGHMALSRPIDNSFILLARHRNLSGHTIGINPQEVAGAQMSYETKIDGAGAAVIPDVVPYFYRPVKIDTRHLPAGYDIGQDHFISLPSYKRGTLVTVGSAANIYADGYIRHGDGTPAALEAGVITARHDPDMPPQEFFTNRNGRMRISRLAPGSYDLNLYAWPGRRIRLDIPDHAPFGRYDAGILTLQEALP
ncbi:MAG: fimbria/pilus outer membrane usher protein [Alphaproteobacteria bacterium]